MTLLRFAAATVVIGVVAAVPMGLRQPPSKRIAPTPPDKTASVRVEHEFVRFDADPLPVVAESGNSGRAAPSRRVSRKRPDTLADKTRRVLLGDGRHRPEPFPRAR